jgi:hypothetical protein
MVDSVVRQCSWNSDFPTAEIQYEIAENYYGDKNYA